MEVMAFGMCISYSSSGGDINNLREDSLCLTVSKGSAHGCLAPFSWQNIIMVRVHHEKASSWQTGS